MQYILITFDIFKNKNLNKKNFNNFRNIINNIDKFNNQYINKFLLEDEKILNEENKINILYERIYKILSLKYNQFEICLFFFLYLNWFDFQTKNFNIKNNNIFSLTEENKNNEFKNLLYNKLKFLLPKNILNTCFNNSNISINSNNGKTEINEFNNNFIINENRSYITNNILNNSFNIYNNKSGKIENNYSNLKFNLQNKKKIKNSNFYETNMIIIKYKKYKIFKIIKDIFIYLTEKWNIDFKNIKIPKHNLPIIKKPKSFLGKIKKK